MSNFLSEEAAGFAADAADAQLPHAERKHEKYERLIMQARDLPAVPTAAAINIFPDVEIKRDIVQNAIDLFIGLGLSEPRVAILSAVEVINPRSGYLFMS